MTRPLLFCAFAFFALGCQPDRPKAPTVEVAMKHFNDQLANKCPQKHLDTQLPPDKFNEFAKEYRNDADTQSQQLIDLNTHDVCKAGGSEPECYNQGFIQAEVQIGGIDETVKATCAKF